MSATWVDPNFTSQDATTYKASLDGAAKVAKRIVDAFAPHESSPQAMTVTIDAGAVLNGVTLTEKTAQTTGTITAPVGNPRIDRVVIDAATGVISVITGTPAGSPAPPAITSGKLPNCQVLLQTSSTFIGNSMITDERSLVYGNVLASVVATTGVVTPLVQASGVNLVLESTGSNVVFKINGTNYWQINNPDLLPSADDTSSAGSAGLRIKQLFSRILDSGAGSLVLKGAGTTAQTITGANTVLGGTLDLGSTGQIIFPSTQNASAGANTLDDYEKGTWTPVIGISGTAFSAGPSGKYWKIGPRVDIKWSSATITNLNGATTQTVRVSSLPISMAEGGSIDPIQWTGSATAFVFMGTRADDLNNILVLEGTTAAATTLGVVQATQVGTGGSVGGWARYAGT